MRPRLAACILITLANTCRWLGRETNCIPRWGRSVCNYTTPHNSVPSSWPMVPLYTPSLHDQNRQDCVLSWSWTISLFRTQRTREDQNCANLIYSCKRSTRLRRTRGDPFPSSDILRTFSYIYVCARTCARWHVGVEPTFSNVLSAVFQSSSTFSAMFFNSLSVNRSLRSWRKSRLF